MRQIGDENEENNRLGVILLIKDQILITNVQENVWQSEGRISLWILRGRVRVFGYYGDNTGT